MNRIPIVLAIAALAAGCGADLATTAASSAALKKKEIEEGRKTMQRTEQKIGQAMEQAEQRTKEADEQAAK